MNRIKDKIRQIQKMIQELNSIMPKSFKEYLDIKTKAACERYSENMIQAQTDLAILTLKEIDAKLPEEDLNAYDILEREKVISKELKEKLKKAKGMRNIIAHEYGKIDDKIVYRTLKEILIEDTISYIDHIHSYLIASKGRTTREDMKK